MDEQPHLRFNPLKGEWVVVSPHRTKRPWKGQVEKQQEAVIPRRDLNNPLVPSAVRASGAKNPEYDGVYVFNNDFPALLEEGGEGGQECDDGLFQSASAQGTCRVMCFHPWSDMILPLMDTKDVVKVVEEWIRQFVELSKKYRWVQVWLKRHIEGMRSTKGGGGPLYCTLILVVHYPYHFLMQKLGTYLTCKSNLLSNTYSKQIIIPILIVIFHFRYLRIVVR